MENREASLWRNSSAGIAPKFFRTILCFVALVYNWYFFQNSLLVKMASKTLTRSIPIPTIIVKSVGKAATSYLFFLPPLTLAQCWTKRECLCAELFCYIPSVESFRFRDKDDCVNEIFSILSSGRARTNVILAGKCGSRRQSAKSFSENIF